MANYAFRRDDTVQARTQFLTPGGDPSTFRSVASARLGAEVVTAVDTLEPGRGFFAESAETVTAADTLIEVPGSARRSNETLTATDAPQQQRVVASERRSDEVLTAVDSPKRVLNFFRGPENETVTAVDALPVANLGKDEVSNETATAVDTISLAVGYSRRSDEVLTAVDETSPQIRPRPGVGLVLRPFRNGTDQDFSLFPDGGEQAYEDVDDLPGAPDDATTYVFNSSVVGEAFTVQLNPVLLPVSSPHRIQGLTLLLRVRDTTATATFAPRFRLHGRLFDDDTNNEITISTTGWKDYYFWYPQNVFGQRQWTSSDLLDLEVGLVNTSTVGLELTQATVWVATEPMPHRSLNLNANGPHGDWTLTRPTTPGASIPIALALDDADRTYITSTSAADQQSVRSTQTVLFPEQFQVDKIQLNIRARGDGGFIKPLVREDGFDQSGLGGDWLIPVDDDLDVNNNSGTFRTWQVPFHSRPRFLTGMSRWSLADVLAADWGVENEDAETVQVSHVGVDIFASLIPESEQRLLPTANGFHQEWNIQAPNAGEDAYEDVNSYNLDDSSYLRADATVAAKRVTFQITSTLDEHLYGVRWRARLRREPSAPAAPTKIAPLLRQNGITYIGRTFEFGVDGASTTFIELNEDFWVSPFDGRPWEDDALQTIEVGVILFEGRADLSWCTLEAGIVPPREHGNDAVEFDFTDTGEANVIRSAADDLVWKIDRFIVGRGGFQRDNPPVVQPIETSDDTLEDPLFTGKVIKTTFVGRTAYYWLAFPPDVFSDPIGEVMLMARIVSSSNPADTPDTYFPMAVGHFPAGFHTLRSIRVLRVALTYDVISESTVDTVTAVDTVTVEPSNGFAAERSESETLTAVDTLTES